MASRSSRRRVGGSSRRTPLGTSTALLSAAIQQKFMVGMGRPRPRRAKKPKPKPKPVELTDMDWLVIIDASRARDGSREPCSICHEPYHETEQILLSCSHTFHSACFRNFERFCPRKPRCPICRTEGYQKRVIRDGYRCWRHDSATRIQAAWRGWKDRCRIERLMSENPPKDEKVRARFYMRKFGRTANRLVSLVEEKGRDIDALLKEFDAGMALQRSALLAAEEQFASRSSEEWDAIRKRAEQLEQSSCPICVMTFDQTRKKPVSLLSCSHLFHEACLHSFEKFTAAQDNTNADACCPLCRAPYQKTRW